ncbi:phosphorylcholine transferase LicD [Spirochaetia bacterium]|nr:phosphorylcholine transferase LicD [Spirochaetia bacterium]
MDNSRENFRTEIKEYVGLLYDQFILYQDKLMDLLIEFNRICKENNIIYFSAYGTLIGMIRHQAMIPWDYDGDVLVPITEKEKLIAALKNNLSEKYYIYCPETVRECPHWFMRISEKGYSASVFHLDVFYLIGAPSKKNQQKSFQRRINLLMDLRYSKTLYPDYEYPNKLKLKCRKILRFILKSIPMWLLKGLFNQLCYKYSFKESLYYYPTLKEDIQFFPREIFGKNIEFETGENKFYIPENYRENLEYIYSDFMQIPPIKSRFEEFFSSISRLQRYEEFNK